MFQKLILMVFFAGLVFISCPDDNGREMNDSSPGIICLQFTVANNFNEPVKMSIRHAYDTKEKKHWRYSDWSEVVTIQPGTSQSIGNEHLEIVRNGQDETISGFILWNRSLDDGFSWYAQSASFEAKVQFSNTVNYIAGFKTENTKFAETGFGEMQIKSDTYTRSASFVFNEKSYPVRSSVFGPVTLTINADGSYDIEYDEDVLQKAERWE